MVQFLYAFSQFGWISGVLVAQGTSGEGVVLALGGTSQALLKVEDGVFERLLHELGGVVVSQVDGHRRRTRRRVLEAEGGGLEALTSSSLSGGRGGFFFGRVLVDAINVLMDTITLLPLEAHQRFQLFALPSPGLS